MRLEETLLQTAKELGFDNYQVIDTAALHFDERFRMYCETNYCGNYDNNYSCPPACGEAKELGDKARAFERALVLQTITPVKDITNDSETKEIKRRHKQDRKSTRLNSSHVKRSRMPSSA